MSKMLLMRNPMKEEEWTNNMVTKKDLDEYVKSKPKGEGFDDNDSDGRYICYNCVFMAGCEGNELIWCNNGSCRNYDHFVERKYK